MNVLWRLMITIYACFLPQWCVCWFEQVSLLPDRVTLVILLAFEQRKHNTLRSQRHQTVAPHISHAHFAHLAWTGFWRCRPKQIHNFVGRMQMSDAKSEQKTECVPLCAEQGYAYFVGEHLRIIMKVFKHLKTWPLATDKIVSNLFVINFLTPVVHY